MSAAAQEMVGNQLVPVLVFDTTLRDGAQAVDVHPNRDQSICVANFLSGIGINVVEAGFPVSSRENFQTTREIAEALKDTGTEVAAFARTSPDDVEKAGEAVAILGTKGRINVCAPVSDLHIVERLRTNRDGLLKMAVENTELAASMTPNVQFSLEDATRADEGYLHKVAYSVADAGARTLMVPDTVGALLPHEYQALMQRLRGGLDERGHKDVVLSAHCHNDLGQASMESLYGIMGGARQVEATILGVGERNGNLKLEEIVGLLAVRADLGYRTDVDPTKLREMVFELGVEELDQRPSERAVFVGILSYIHGSGMHQDGVAKGGSRAYKDFNSRTFGFEDEFEFMLNDQSGKAAVKYTLEQLGIYISKDQLVEVTTQMKALSVAEGKRNLGHDELERLASLVSGEDFDGGRLALDHFTFHGDIEGNCESTVSIRGNEITKQSEGGVVDAAKLAVNELTSFDGDIVGWHVDDVGTKGSDAKVGVYVTVKQNGRKVMAYSESRISEQAGVEAYLSAVDTIMRAERRQKVLDSPD